MDSYKVLYIDEEEIWRDNFTRYAHNDFDVEAIQPMEKQEELIDYILRSSADAVILDHLLSEHMPEIIYDGVELIKQLKKRSPHFPFFVLTSHDLQAMEEAEDVNYIYPKSVISEREEQNNSKGKFKDRLRLQIKHYLDSIQDAEREFDTLIKKADKAPLDSDEEGRLIYLDTFLNQQIGLDLDIPEHLKKTSNAELTLELIKVSEELIQKINNTQGGDNA